MEVEGDGWSVVRKEPIDWTALDRFSVPGGDWFWVSLERYCVAGCCGLAAFEFTHEAVRFACGDDIEAPSNAWRSDSPGDSAALAASLRKLASDLRERPVELVDSPRLCEPGTPASYATLFDRLAHWLEFPIPGPLQSGVAG